MELPVAELYHQESIVRHAEERQSATYGQLAEVAATMPCPSGQLTLKPRREFQASRQAVTGVDNEKIVRGKPLFSIDQRVPGMLYATFTKAPAIGGRATSANLDKVQTCAA